MSATTAVRAASRSPLYYRLQRYGGARRRACALGFVLVVWSLTPIYNMWMIALDSHEAYSAARSGRKTRRWRASAS